MPTYDYRCDACGHTFEEWQSFHDAELTKCPACKKKKLVRLLGGGAAIIFKGSGFYETDYRSDSYKEAAKADAAPKADGGDAKVEGKTETTAETPKAEPAPAAKSSGGGGKSSKGGKGGKA